MSSKKITTKGAKSLVKTAGKLQKRSPVVRKKTTMQPTLAVTSTKPKLLIRLLDRLDNTGPKIHRSWKLFILGFSSVLILLPSVTYIFAYNYQHSHRDEPLQLGATFISSYAEYFDLNAKETLSAILGDLNVKHLRLVSYWSAHEKTKGTYDFSDLDWQFKMAEERGATITLALGLRQPRWPECHMPSWTVQEQDSQWIPELQKYIEVTVDRYKNSPALVSYQLENEYFLTAFTRCRENSRERLVNEYQAVRAHDPLHQISMNLSSDFGISIGKPDPDLYGMALYQRVYESRFLKRYITYPYPSWLYAGRAGFQEFAKGKPAFIHEMQAEPWGPTVVKEMSLAEQDKSMSAELFRDRFQYVFDTGIRKIDMWGAEWWYWRKIHFNDPSLWNTAKDTLAKCDGKSRAVETCLKK